MKHYGDRGGCYRRKVMVEGQIYPRYWIPFGFPSRKWIPLINMHKGRVHDVTHCYNQGKKCLPPY